MRSGKYGRGISHLDCRLPVWGEGMSKLGVELQGGLWNGRATMRICQGERGKVLLGLWIAHVWGGNVRVGGWNFKLGCGMAM